MEDYLQDNTWHHITGISTSENVRLYINGELVDRSPLTSGAPVTITWPLSPDNPYA